MCTEFVLWTFSDLHFQFEFLSQVGQQRIIAPECRLGSNYVRATIACIENSCEAAHPYANVLTRCVRLNLSSLRFLSTSQKSLS